MMKQGTSRKDSLKQMAIDFYDPLLSISGAVSDKEEAANPYTMHIECFV